MYTEAQRTELLEKIVAFIQTEPVFTGLVQIGSGAMGYRDIYSDIDLMAGCTDAHAVLTAKEKLTLYFESLDAVYIDQRRWSETVLGQSVYFENGLNVDLSFMPTEEIRLRSDLWRILICKTDSFRQHLEACADQIANRARCGLDDTVHHRFLYALRRCEIALCRDSMIYADMALHEARELLLLVQAAREGKKLHQIKEFDSLHNDFLVRLEHTYPALRNRQEMKAAMDSMLKLYMDTVSECAFLTFDERQLHLIGKFQYRG